MHVCIKARICEIDHRPSVDFISKLIQCTDAMHGAGVGVASDVVSYQTASDKPLHRHRDSPVHNVSDLLK